MTTFQMINSNSMTKLNDLFQVFSEFSTNASVTGKIFLKHHFKSYELILFLYTGTYFTDEFLKDYLQYKYLIIRGIHINLICLFYAIYKSVFLQIKLLNKLILFPLNRMCSFFYSNSRLKLLFRYL